MTAKETIKLAKVGQKVDDMQEDVAEIKTDLKEMNTKIDAFITSANSTFLTVAQAKLIGWIIGVLLLATSVITGVLAYFKAH